jgi:iron complex transport system substrate-binding protein
MHGSVLARAAALAALALLPGCSRDPAPAGAPARAALAARRVVPASATAVDLVAALVEPARIAGVPEQALEYSVLHDAGEEHAAIPRFEAYLAEPVLALRPDLVVIDPWQAPETTARLRRTGVDVLALPEIRGWADARRALEIAGARLGEADRARELVAALEARIARLRERAASRPQLRALAYSNFGGAGSSAGSGTTVDAMFELAGLRNALAERGTGGHVGLTFEELLGLDPDVIVVSRPLKMPEGPAGDRGGASERLLYSEPRLASLRAVAERRVVALPAWLYATGSHEIVHGAEVLSDEVGALLERLAGGEPR